MTWRLVPSGGVNSDISFAERINAFPTRIVRDSGASGVALRIKFEDNS